jgi:Domain of unknown function (DUF4333)
MRSLILAVAVLALASCGGVDTVPADEVATDVAALLEQEVGVRPEIVCPDPVPAEVGASTRCTLTAGDDPTEYGVTVSVASVEDGEPEYAVEVDREPLD